MGSMGSVDVVQSDSTVAEIVRNARRRLTELRPLVTEAERLEEVIKLLAGEEAASAAQGPVEMPTQPSAAASTKPVPRMKTARGANKRRILDVVAQHPGIKPAAISEKISLDKTIVASTVSRLKRNHELEAHPSGGVQLPSRDRVAGAAGH